MIDPHARFGDILALAPLAQLLEQWFYLTPGIVEKGVVGVDLACLDPLPNELRTVLSLLLIFQKEVLFGVMPIHTKGGGVTYEKKRICKIKPQTENTTPAAIKTRTSPFEAQRVPFRAVFPNDVLAA